MQMCKPKIVEIASALLGFAPPHSNIKKLSILNKRMKQNENCFFFLLMCGFNNEFFFGNNKSIWAIHSIIFN